MLNGREAVEGFSPEAAGQNLIDSQIFPQTALRVESLFSKITPLAQLVRNKWLQSTAAVLIGGASLLLAVDYDKNDAQAKEPNFPDPAPKKPLEIKGVMPSQKELTDPCAGYTKIADDVFGPEESRECLESRYPIRMGAWDYVKDANGDVVKQRLVINYNEYWEAVRNPVTGKFSTDWQFIGNVPIGHVTSMTSSSDGNTVIFGGESTFTFGDAALAISTDAGRTSTILPKPFSNPGAPVGDLVRLTENNYLGNTGNAYDRGNNSGGLFTVTIDPLTGERTTQPISPSTGSVHSLGVTAVNTSTHTADFISTGSSWNLRYGILTGRLEYLANIMATDHITRVTFNGIPYNLSWLYGVDEDPQNPDILKTSDDYQNLLSINKVTKEATWQNYAAICDDKLPNYLNGTFRAGSVGVYIDANGNKGTMLGGGGNGHAIMVVLETESCISFGSNVGSSVYAMLREKMSGQSGHEAIMWRHGKAFVPDGSTVPIFTTRGLGIKPEPTPIPTPSPTPTPAMSPRIYLPLIFGN